MSKAIELGGGAERMKKFEQFLASKKLVWIQEEVRNGNDYAQSYFEIEGEPDYDLTVLGYSTSPEEPAKLFISIFNGEYVLEIANTAETAKTDEELRKLEIELFNWAYDEGYFD